MDFTQKWILNMFFASSEVSCHDIKKRGRVPSLDKPLNYIID